MAYSRVPSLNKTQKAFAMMIAMHVRNSMEDFHKDHLSDKQMKELNPIIRNAIVEALHMNWHNRNPIAKAMISYLVWMMPKYWEEPKLTNEYKRSWKKLSEIKNPEKIAKNLISFTN